MSISTALNSALSGLGAASRSAQVVSSNISNALTTGYARRDIDLAATPTGGVRVTSVSRASDPVALSARRAGEAQAGHARTLSDAHATLASALGDIGSVQSLSGQAARFDALLLEAASRPDSPTRLDALAAGARDLAATLNRASETIQGARLKADSDIAGQVATLTGGLTRIADLNAQIMSASVRGADANGLKDLRQAELDTISDIVPIRILPRANDTIALLTTGGQILLEHEPVDIGFTAANAMSASATLSSPLSELTVGGRVIDMSRDAGRLAGGTLQAAFDIRDATGPQAQTELDAIARDLITRFEAVDTTQPAGAPGLFTDAGAPLSTAPPPGLASRIALNAAADPDQGGTAWKLRSGLGSANAGPPGDATLLRAWRDALAAPTTATAPSLSGNPRSFAAHVDQAMALATGRQYRAETETTFAAAQLDDLRQQELEQGVDTDDELQKLLLIERIYGANTKVIQAADAMLQRLMEI